MLDLVKIEPLNLIGSDERGITASFTLPRSQAEFLFLTRNAGSISGNTYHEGKSPATSPKIFILFLGKIKISYRKIGSTNKFCNIVEAPASIQVMPYVTHQIEVIEDACVIECNSINDIQNDRIKEPV